MRSDVPWVLGRFDVCWQRGEVLERKPILWSFGQSRLKTQFLHNLSEIKIGKGKGCQSIGSQDRTGESAPSTNSLGWLGRRLSC
jgi:hypothetical protein